MLPLLIGVGVLAAWAASAYLLPKTVPAVIAAAPAPTPVLNEREAILQRLIKSGAKPSWGLIVPEKWKHRAESS